MLTSDDVPVAMTAGVLRPVLLLNSAAPDWPSDLRHAVLLHELAHVRRRDWITFLLGELAVGVYWFHPLAWLVRRQTRSNAERACDDQVIGDGTKPSAYAAQLLDVVRSFRRDARATLPVMAMARPSQFEGRVRAILDPDLRRREPSGRMLRLAVVGLLASVVALATVEPWATRTVEAASLPVLPAVMAALPAAVPAPRVPPAHIEKTSEKAECKATPAKTTSKRKCGKKAAPSAGRPLASV
jgi:beta-lactamase regulating signal transducer with metallopeptidase domain